MFRFFRSMGDEDRERELREEFEAEVRNQPLPLKSTISKLIKQYGDKAVREELDLQLLPEWLDRK